MEVVDSLSNLVQKPNGVYKLISDPLNIYVVVTGVYTMLPQAAYDLVVKGQCKYDIIELKKAGFNTGDLLLLKKEGLI